MTALIATFTHVPAPFANAVSRTVSTMKIVVDAYAEAQLQIDAARKRYPYLAW